MKKIYTILAALFCCAMMNAETYGLNVGGVQVTSDNASDILGNGTASYDASSATLTLNNADIRMDGKGAIVAAGELKIKVLGNNNYIAVNNLGEYAGAAIQTAGTLSIFAPSDATEFSKLQIVCGAAPAFYALTGDIRLSYVINIDIKGGTGAYGCIKTLNGDLYLNGAGLSMLPGWVRVNNIYLTAGRSELTSPSDAVVNNGRIIRSGTSSEYGITQQVVISSLFRKLIIGVDPKTSPNTISAKSASIGNLSISGQKAVFVGIDEEIELKANTSEGYEFDSWWKVTSAGTGIFAEEQETTFKMNENTQIIYALFNKIYDLNVHVTAANDGNIAICNDEPTELSLTQHYIAQTPVTLKAIAGYGYKFVGWANSYSGTPFSTENPLSTTKKAANEDIYAQFETVSVEDKVSKGVFTIGQNKYARLATGNLQYQPFTAKWRFAFEEYDAIGDANKDISSTSLEWFDLFGWGTGNNPAETSKDEKAYSDFNEWGDNPIVNGGNTEKQWRTPTEVEWRYIFSARPNAAAKWGLAKIEDHLPGIILIPDNFEYPSLNTNHNSYNDNLFTATQFRWLEQQGVIYLPVTGNREGTTVSDASSRAWYWTADPEEDDYAHYMIIKSEGNAYGFGFRHRGQAVRLLQEVENPQGMESVQHSAVSSQKVLREGVLLIEKNGKTYNALGAEIK